MRLIISFILAALMVSCAAPPARSQASLLVVNTCGTLPLAYLPGAVRPGTQDKNGLACSGVTVTGGDATAANQVLQLTQETAINTLLGLQADAACAADNGACTLAALTKRNNQRLTTINTTLGTPMQATGGTVGIVAGTAIVGKIGIDQTTPGTTNGVQVNAALPAGTNVIGKASIDQTTSAVTNGVMNAAGHYETVAASQTAQAMGATGAAGDYLSHCVVYPTSTSPGVVTVFDSTSSAGNNVIAFPGGASSLSNLAPFAIPVGAISLNGAWKVTTGASVVVTCYGKFT